MTKTFVEFTSFIQLTLDSNTYIVNNPSVFYALRLTGKH